MKKIIAALAVAFLVFACDNDSVETANEPVNPFVGTWETSEGFRIDFTTTTISGFYSDGHLHYTGVYTYNETHLTINLNKTTSDQDIVESWGETALIPYRFEGEILFFYYTPLNRIVTQ